MLIQQWTEHCNKMEQILIQQWTEHCNKRDIILCVRIMYINSTMLRKHKYALIIA